MNYRQAQNSDVSAMAWPGLDGEEGRASEDRMSRYLEGTHHPQHALAPRVIFVGLENDLVVGYVAGHLTRRFGCDGELQWIYVVAEHRRGGIGSGLLGLLSGWFAAQKASKVCVNVAATNTVGRCFYARHGAEVLNEHWLVWRDMSVVEG
jgi:GNAT superfamily N-acetyltransferase